MLAARRLAAVVVITAFQLVVCTDDAKENTVLVNDDMSGLVWMYKCMPEQGCHRAPRPLPTAASAETQSPKQHQYSSEYYYESLDICHMSCGRFGGLWPKPSTVALSAQTVPIHPNYLRFDLIDAPPATRDLLADMSQVLTQNLLAECGGTVTSVVDTPVVVFLNVKSADMTLSWETDESYILDLQSKGSDVTVHIIADTVFGARHGLESLSQLVSANRSVYEDQKQCGLQILAGAKIKDKPVYPHRGLVLDTSRNFIPMDAIKRTIDGMGASKMNVLHWHATDSHSFPLESTRVPLLTKYGAYSASEVYSVSEIKELLKYARIRGVRVVLEIDSPAHAGNGWQWGKEYGMGELAVCVNAQPWRPLCIQPPCGQLNPANPNVYTVLRDLYRDIIELWPQGELFHMGGDEVFINCWNSTEEIVTYMQGKGLDRSVESFVRVWAEFHSMILGIWDEENQAAGALGKAPVMLWSSELTQADRIQSFLNKDRYIIEVWEPYSSPLLNQLVKLGYRVVSAPKDVWYLDHGFWGNTKYANWRRMYAHLLPKQANVLGGEVAMWSEYVDDNALDGRVWPRAAAVAERLWSDPTSPAGDAEPRLQRHRARLVARGLRADVLSPQWCTQHDKRCV